MRLAPIAAAMVAGMTVSAGAQFLAPGMPPPGYSQPQQQMPPCFHEFAPLRAEAEKRGLAVKGAMERKAAREEACTLLKRYSEAESRIVKFIKANAASCGIPPEAGAQMAANHARTQKSVTHVCSTAGGPARPTGPGLSEALGTTRSGSILDPSAPQSGTLDTLTGNVLSR
jgi:hypothetical protein